MSEVKYVIPKLKIEEGQDRLAVCNWYLWKDGVLMGIFPSEESARRTEREILEFFSEDDAWRNL